MRCAAYDDDEAPVEQDVAPVEEVTDELIAILDVVQEIYDYPGDDE